MSDLSKIFKAYDVRAVYPDPLDEDAAWKVGYAAGQFLQNQAGLTGRGTVLVSRDMRPHSPGLAKALGLGLRASGVNVIDLGMCDTSFMYFAVNHLDAIGGIQTTASHNPINYNGFKISGRCAKPVGADTGLLDIQKIAVNLVSAYSVEPVGSYEQRDLWAAYRQHVLQFLAPLQRPLTVFIDGSNGMAGRMIPAIFEGVPNLKIIPVNFEITGSFVHEPNPLVARNMIPTQEGVRLHRADLGACFDGDADRCMITDQTGQIVGCDHLTALFCSHFLAQAPGSSVVYDLRSSKAVQEEILRLGGTPRRCKVGHVFMKGLLRQTGGIFGGELSGHFYFRDNFFADSGAIAFAAVCSILSRSNLPLSQLIAPFKKYPQSGERNFRAADKVAALQAIKSRWAKTADIDELDGVTVDAWEPRKGSFDGKENATAGGFWFNVRASNTEPLLRLNAEARDQAALDNILAQVQPMLGTPDLGGH